MRIRGETTKQNFDALVALVGLKTVSLNLNPSVLFLLQYKIRIREALKKNCKIFDNLSKGG